MGTPKNLMFEKIPFFFLVSKLSHPTTLCLPWKKSSFNSIICFNVALLWEESFAVGFKHATHPHICTYLHTYFKGIHSKFQGFGDGDWKTTTTQNAKKEHFQVCHSSLFYFTDRPTKRIDVKSRELFSSWEICSINTKVCMLTFFYQARLTDRQSTKIVHTHKLI